MITASEVAFKLGQCQQIADDMVCELTQAIEGIDSSNFTMNRTHLIVALVKAERIRDIWEEEGVGYMCPEEKGK